MAKGVSRMEFLSGAELKLLYIKSNTARTFDEHATVVSEWLNYLNDTIYHREICISVMNFKEAVGAPHNYVEQLRQDLCGDKSLLSQANIDIHIPNKITKRFGILKSLLQENQANLIEWTTQLAQNKSA